MVSVHDNLVYAQSVDYESCRVILHTFFRRRRNRVRMAVRGNLGEP